MTLKAEEVVTVIDDTKPWWQVLTANGTEGKAPSNYLQRVENTDVAHVNHGPQAVESYSWFHADCVDRTLAEQRLNYCRTACGTFLVRRSGSEANAYTLSMRYDKRNVLQWGLTWFHLVLPQGGNQHYSFEDSATR